MPKLEDIIAVSYARQMLDSCPHDFIVDAGVLAAAIEALGDCAQVCTACADDCLSEQNVAELTNSDIPPAIPPASRNRG